MESRALVLAVALLTLAGCKAFGEDGGSSEQQEQTVEPQPVPATSPPTPPAAPPPAPPATLEAPEPSPPPLEPPPGAKGWKGALPGPTEAQYSDGLCTHSIEVKNVTVEVATGSDGALLEAQVTTKTVHARKLPCADLFADEDSLVFKLDRAETTSTPGSNHMVLVATKDPKKVLTIDGRFDQSDTSILKLEWRGVAKDAPTNWSFKAEVTVTGTAVPQ